MRRQQRLSKGNGYLEYERFHTVDPPCLSHRVTSATKAYVLSDVVLIPIAHPLCLVSMLNAWILALRMVHLVASMLCAAYPITVPYVFVPKAFKVNPAKNVINWNVIAPTIANPTNAAARTGFVRILVYNTAFVDSMRNAEWSTGMRNVLVLLDIMVIQKSIVKKVRAHLRKKNTYDHLTMDLIIRRRRMFEKTLRSQRQMPGDFERFRMYLRSELSRQSTSSVHLRRRKSL